MEIESTISNGNATEIRLQTKITGVNIDCLEEIFKYLELKDLLNVADSNKRLRRAASFIFASTYQPKIQINHSKTQRFWRMTYYRRCNNAMNSEMVKKLERGQQLDTLKICFQLFRCFGNRITILKITNANEFEFADKSKTFCESYITAYERLLSQVNEYCYESLKEINTFGCPQSSFNQLKKPFFKVEILQTNDSILKTSLWNVLFPQLRNLGYYCSPKTTTFYGIDNNFPHLERLKWTFDKKTDICTALSLNPQLRALELVAATDLNTLQTIACSLPALEELKLTINKEIGQILQTNPIHFKSVKKFHTINNAPYLGEHGVMIGETYKFPPKFDFPFTFDKLEELSCHMDSFESAETFHKFLKVNPLIMKLRLWQNDINLMMPSELAKILPLLKEIEIIDDIDDLEKLIELGNEIKTLRMVSVKITKWEDVNYLSSRMRLKNVSVVRRTCFGTYEIQLFIA